jgi:RecJ-like exonuclease
MPSAPQNPGRMNPGDEATPGSAQSGEAICPKCGGTGKLAGSKECDNCGGTGIVVQLVGDA